MATNSTTTTTPPPPPAPGHPNTSTIIPDVPTLDKAPPARKAISHALFLFLILGAILLAWLAGFDLFQTQRPDASWLERGASLAAVFAGVSFLIYSAGTPNLDLWELVTTYWWLCFPAVAAAGILLAVMQESTVEIERLD